ncbi:unnamed protein product, partial [Allacma fusca]
SCNVRWLGFVEHSEFSRDLQRYL